MTDVNEAQLPGVGLRHDFVPKSGRAVGVVSHHTGRRDLVVYAEDDPDTAVATVELKEEEAQTLAELLGGSRIVERLEELPHHVSGLVIDWLQVDAASPVAGKAIAESRIRTRTGASIVAVVRSDTALPAPGPENVLESGDTVVVVGTPDGVDAITELLEGPGPSAQA